MGEAARHGGTTPARVRLRRAVALVAGALVLTSAGSPVQAFASASGTPAARPAEGVSGAVSATARTSALTVPAKAAAASETSKISLDSLSPAVPGEGDTLTISGTVTNNGKETITDAHVGVRVGLDGQPLISRSNLAEVSSRKAVITADGSEITDHTADLPDLAPGRSRPFSLKVPTDSLNLQGNGVYQLGVSLLGQTEDADFPHLLGIQRTFLPWYPNPDATQHTKVAMAWPLIDQPHMDARTDSDAQQTPVFRDDRLTAELAPGGRLEQMVSIGKDLPVTWVVDPDLIATVDAMARGYKVAGNDDTIEGAEPGSGSEVAKKWLNELKSAVEDEPVVALPFGDPDLASLAHSGKGVDGSLDHLGTATALARQTVETVLDVKPRTDVAWPEDGALDPSVMKAVKASRADTVIASSTSLGSGTLNRTPDAPRKLGGGITAVVADSPLSHAFTENMSDDGTATLAVQRFLAESLMITMEAPSTGRSILVVPQRRPTAAAAKTMAKALTEAEGGGWVTTASLSSVEGATPDDGADRTVPSASEYPKELRERELSSSAFERIQDTKTTLQRFLQILSRTDRATTPFTTAVLRSVSNSWRTDAGGGKAFRRSVQDYLDGLGNAVHIRTKSDVTLSGDNGTIQVTVENNLNQQVQDLVLKLRSTQNQRFSVSDVREVTIAGEHRKSFKFEATAHANGRATVVAQLYTADGTAYGDPMTFRVNVTSVTGTVIVVIVCGVLLVALAGVRMYRQRKRIAARAAAAEAAAEASAGEETGVEEAAAEDATHGSAVTDVAGEERSGDPNPDTSDEMVEPDAADEKVER